jgi:hypothetical protein
MHTVQAIAITVTRWNCSVIILLRNQDTVHHFKWQNTAGWQDYTRLLVCAMISYGNGSMETAQISMVAKIRSIAMHPGRPEFDSRQELGFFFFRYRIQTGSGAHQASYPMGTGDTYPESKATAA